jgi:membrane protein DedA with SNARE-associated domain
MYKALLHTHSGFRYIVLALVVTLLFKSLSGWLGKKPFTKADDKISLFFFISAHTMLLFGLVLYFVSPQVQFGSGVMANPQARYWTVEHISANIIAIVFFSIARIKAKKLTDNTAKHKTLFIYTLIGFLVLIASLSAPMAPGLFGSSVM